MALDDELNGHNDIAQFLEKFKEQPFTQQPPREPYAERENVAPVRPAQYARSFEKLEQKIHELEEKFEASTTQNRLILSELARTREVVERQKDKDAFLEHLSRTIATLRTSVENLSQAQQTQSFSFREVPVQRSFDPLPTVFAPVNTDAGTAYAAAQEAATLRRERQEQDRLFNSLRQKASQLKAVNSALDREIKKAQQEKLEALKKSADQAKEILSLRDQLNAAEERFKAFNFEGRIISIKKEYQQKVTHLETQLKEMSDTCMKQVEEIESLKAENAKLQTAAAQKEALQAQLADKDQQLQSLKQTIATLQNQHSDQHTQQLAAFTAQLRTLEEQRDRLAVELEQSQIAVETIRREKDLLEKNFKQLVVKINHNDSIIGQLKQKIEVLGQQNMQLTQHNEKLAQTNTDLSHNNQVLSQNNAQLTQHNEELEKANTTLVQDNKTLSQTNVVLTQRNAALTQHNSSLTRQTQELQTQRGELTQKMESLYQEQKELSKRVEESEKENKELLEKVSQKEQETVLSVEKSAPAEEKTQPQPEILHTDKQEEAVSVSGTSSAALLAARVVQQHSRQVAREKQHEQTDAEEAVASESSLRRPKEPILHSLGRTLQSHAAEEEWEVISAPAVSSSQSTAIKSEDDLPEIKVADPIPQDDIFEGEDFLEKTNSFIGRMKWSIFRENR